MAQGPSSRGSESLRAADEPLRAANGPQGTPGGGAAETGDDEKLDSMLGEFRILRRLGKGGMAEVFLAEQTSLKRHVAIKMLREERLADETHLKRFKTEATAAGALNHPNIVQVYTIGEQNGIHYIAQEYVQGMNLREYVTRKGPPEMGVALHIIKQVASALQAAHAAGIVHRDIKPENIMLTRRGDVKVADFGLAQLTEDGERVNLTQVGVTMGTPLYMSPEQVNGRKLDARTDIYSLGVTCYHMLTGAPPFRGETALSVAVQHLKQEPERLEQIRGDLPPVLCRIIHKMMAKKPENRYQSAQEILRDLKRLTQGATGADAAQEAVDEAGTRGGEKAAGGSFFGRLAAGIWRLPDRSVKSQIAVLLVGALLTGVASAGVGWIVRDPDPFSTPAVPEPEATRRRDTIAQQYYHALNVKIDPAAWQAVIDYSPASPFFQNRAKEQLAMLHLTRGRIEDASALFDQLARETQQEWRAFGLAGQAYILQYHAEYGNARKVIEELKPLYGKLDGPMRALFNETVGRNFKAMNEQIDQEWQRLLAAPQPDAASHTDPAP